MNKHYHNLIELSTTLTDRCYDLKRAEEYTYPNPIFRSVAIINCQNRVEQAIRPLLKEIEEL